MGTLVMDKIIEQTSFGGRYRVVCPLYEGDPEHKVMYEFGKYPTFMAGKTFSCEATLIRWHDEKWPRWREHVVYKEAIKPLRFRKI